MQNNTFVKTFIAIALILACAGLSFGQTTMTSTTLSAAVNATQTTLTVASATNITGPGPNGSNRTVLFIDRSAYFVTAVSGTTISVVRGVKGTVGNAAHLSGATVWVGPDRSQYFVGTATSPDLTKRGACTATDQPILPVIEIASGRALTCAGTPGRWGVLTAMRVNPADCTFAPTTLTTTNILTQIGTSTHMVMQGTSNAAAGTNTLTCNIVLPGGSTLVDINTFIGSQTTAPTSVGTATLGSVTYPTASATETASVEAPVAAGGTITTTSPTALTTVTTAGRFLTIKHTFATNVPAVDQTSLIYTMPFLQSAAAAMVLNTPGLLIHVIVSP